jgi:hypothetical protein
MQIRTSLARTYQKIVDLKSALLARLNSIYRQRTEPTLGTSLPNIVSEYSILFLYPAKAKNNIPRASFLANFDFWNRHHG